VSCFGGRKDGESTPTIHEILQSNETAEPHQQPPVEEKLTKGDSSNLQATISKAQSLDEVMQPIPPILSSKEEKQTFIPIWNQGEFFVKPRKIKQSIALEEVSPTTEISEKIEPSLEEFKEVHDKLTEGLPPMRDIQYQGTSIRHDFEDPFLRKENTRDESFQLFKFISPTIGTWTQRKHDPSLSYMEFDEDPRGESRF